MNENTHSASRGPLKLPTQKDVSVRRAMSESLKGHTTSTAWLPEGSWPELDELRREQLRLRQQVELELEALSALDSAFREEDAAHAEALRQAHRDGNVSGMKDRRTPPSERTQAREAIEERLAAGVEVLAEHADAVIATIRCHEDSWLADLRAQLVPAQEKRREAARLLAEAQRDEFKLYKLGQWLTATADDGAFGRQPAPQVTSMPERVAADAYRHALERPWHKRKPWNHSTQGSEA